MTMTTKRQFTTALAALGLAASAVAIAPGVASAQRPSAPGPQLEQFQPTARFIVKAESFTAVDESGIDWPLSDDIYAIWTSGDSGVSTSIVGNVDTGETFPFASTENCVFPIEAPPGGALYSGEDGDEWTCADGGAYAPVEFSVWLFEHDVRLTCSETLIAGGVLLESCADDLIGFFEFSLDESQMVQTFVSAGSTRAVTKHLGGPCGYVPPGKVVGCSDIGTGPEYDFRFRITRVADGRGPVFALPDAQPSPRTAPAPTARPAANPVAPAKAEPAPAPRQQRAPWATSQRR